MNIRYPIYEGVYRILTKGVPFDATVIFDESFNLKLSFPKSKGGKGK